MDVSDDGFSDEVNDVGDADTCDRNGDNPKDGRGGGGAAAAAAALAKIETDLGLNDFLK